MCSLAALMSVVLGSGTLAAAEHGIPEPVDTGNNRENIVTGMVVSVSKDGYIEIGHWGRIRTHADDNGTGWAAHLYRPKVGEIVRVHCHLCGRFDHCATKIEKVGKAELGTKNR
jgi:hypothetical protein